MNWTGMATVVFLAQVAGPLLIASAGELVGQRVGLINLGIEGEMVLGAFVGWVVAMTVPSPVLALVVASFCGLFLGFLSWILTDVFEADQRVTGLGLGFLAQGAAYTGYRLVPETLKTQGVIIVTSSPIIALTVLAFILIWLLELRSYKSRMQIEWDLLGRDLRASDLLGISVRGYRLGCALLSHSMACLAGALLSVLVIGNFNLGIVSGRGWIAICLVILARWQPFRLIIVLLCWAFIEWFVNNLQAATRGTYYYQLMLAFPFVLAAIAAGLSGARRYAPASLGRLYRRSEDAS